MFYLRANPSARRMCPTCAPGRVSPAAAAASGANLELDAAAQHELRGQALADLKPVIAARRTRPSIIEPNTPVTRRTDRDAARHYQAYLRREPTAHRRRPADGRPHPARARRHHRRGFLHPSRGSDDAAEQRPARRCWPGLRVQPHPGPPDARRRQHLRCSKRHPDLAASCPISRRWLSRRWSSPCSSAPVPRSFPGCWSASFPRIIFGNRLEVLVLSLVTATVAAYDCRAVAAAPASSARAGCPDWFSPASRSCSAGPRK